MITFRVLARTLAILLFILMPIFALAAVAQWQIIPNESSLTFTATQNNAPVTGQFKTFSGDIAFDPAQLAASHVNIAVDTNSISSSYNEMSDTLKSADWFNVKLFPQAVFKASSFKKLSDKTYQADGTLTIRDKTMPLTLKFDLTEYSPTQLALTGTSSLKRTDFGIGQGEWAKDDVVKDEVQIKFSLTAKPRP